MTDQPDHRGADDLVQRPPSTEWGEGYTSLPDHWRRPIGRLASLAFWTDHGYWQWQRIATNSMLDLGIALADAREVMPDAEYGRWVGALEVDPQTISTAIEIRQMYPDEKLPDREVPMPVHRLRWFAARAEEIWAETKQKLREQVAAVTRLGSAINELRLELGEERMGPVLEALRVGATPKVLDDALASAARYGDSRGIVSEAMIAVVIGGQPSE